MIPNDQQQGRDRKLDRTAVPLPGSSDRRRWPRAGQVQPSVSESPCDLVMNTSATRVRLLGLESGGSPRPADPGLIVFAGQELPQLVMTRSPGHHDVSYSVAGVNRLL